MQDISYTKHFNHVRAFLCGEGVPSLTLWLSVGYFLNGGGKFSKKPWKTEEEKLNLQKITRGDKPKMDGYVEARKLEEKLEKVCKKFPPSDDNKHEWSKFIRTLRVTLDLLEKEDY